MPTKILIADDDAVSRQLLKSLLTKWEYDVVVACNGIEAQSKLRSPAPPRLAILDWMMPGLDGIQVIKELRAVQHDVYTYVLLLTAKGEKSDILQGLDAGADDYLTKPFDAQQLRARLRVGQRILELQQRLLGALETSEFRASHDFLTGLYNRAAVMELLRRELARCEREHTSVAVLIIDADHFKRINDSYGHLIGDEVLKQLSLRIKSALRSYDLLGRYGGEEFLIVAPNCDLADATCIAERVRACVANDKLQIGQLQVTVTVSIGVTRARNVVLELNSMLRNADRALYLAKEKGRNRVDSFVPEECDSTQSAQPGNLVRS